MAAPKEYLTTRGLTLNEIGEELGLSRERIRQIIGEGMKKLRANLDKAGIAFDDLDPSDIRMILDQRYSDSDVE